MAYLELNARRWQAQVGQGGPPPGACDLHALAYFKLNARRWQARVPRGCWGLRAHEDFCALRTDGYDEPKDSSIRSLTAWELDG